MNGRPIASTGPQTAPGSAPRRAAGPALGAAVGIDARRAGRVTSAGWLLAACVALIVAVVVVPGMGDAVQMDKAGILEIADLFVANKADHAGEAKLVRELLDVASGRRIIETIATEGKGVVELLDALLA